MLLFWLSTENNEWEAGNRMDYASDNHKITKIWSNMMYKRLVVLMSKCLCINCRLNNIYIIIRHKISLTWCFVISRMMMPIFLFPFLRRCSNSFFYMWLLPKNDPSSSLWQKLKLAWGCSSYSSTHDWSQTSWTSIIS